MVESAVVAEAVAVTAARAVAMVELVIGPEAVTLAFVAAVVARVRAVVTGVVAAAVVETVEVA